MGHVYEIGSKIPNSRLEENKINLYKNYKKSFSDRALQIREETNWAIKLEQPKFWSGT